MPQRVARRRSGTARACVGRGPEWGQLLGYRGEPEPAPWVIRQSRRIPVRSSLRLRARVCVYTRKLRATSEDFFPRRIHWRFSDLGRYADNRSSRRIYSTVAHRRQVKANSVERMFPRRYTEIGTLLLPASKKLVP